MNIKFLQAARVIARQRSAVALTGAGISVESGIPDFRSKGGLWTRFPPEEYATLQAFRRDPEKVWRMFAEMSQVLDAARPNPAHEALFELERLGVLEGIVTQNIDGLHQRAGSERVVEFHGSILTLTCLGCGERYERGEASLGMPPRCGCGKLLKPDVVLFGEQIPPHAVEESRRLVEHCRVLLVVGTSAEVAPASFLPVQAKRRGAVVVEVNVAPTLLTHEITDIFLEGKAGEVLPKLAEEVKKLLAG